MGEYDFGGLADNVLQPGDYSGSLGSTALDLGLGGSSMGLTSAAPAATAPDTSGGGVGGFLKSVGSGFGDVAKTLLPVAQIGAAGYGVYSGLQAGKQLTQQGQIAQGAEKRQEQIGQAQQDLAKTATTQAAPVAQFGQEELARAQRGEVPGAVQAQIEQWRLAARQMAQDQAARTGQGQSSQLTQWLAWIDQQAEAMKVQALEGQQSLGLQAEGVAGQILGVGGQALGGAANTAAATGQTAAQQQQSLEQLIGNANQVLARLQQGAA